MKGKKRYQRAVSSLASRKEDRPLYFSGQLGITTNGEAQVEVPSRSGFVWVRLRNQLNEVIQAFNETVSTVYDLPVLVKWDEFSPNRYKIVGRDVGRYSDWGSESSYLPIHGAQHQFNTLTGAGGGDIVWVYSQQFQPLLVTPSGTAGAFSVSIQPHVYYWDSEFQYAGGTGVAGFNGLWPTGSSNARMLLLYLDPDTGNVNLATGSLTEFAATLTGTADVIPYVPALIAPEDIPLAAVRLVTGTATIQWPNLYDIRTYFASAGGAYGGSGAPANAQYVTMALNGTLSDERVLTAGADIDLADGGAGGNATVSVETGTFSRPGHAHAGVAHTNELPIYEDGVFVATGTIIDFGANVNVVATGTVVFVSTTDTQGGGGTDLLIYDDGSFKVTGSAISFDDNLIVHITGSTAYIVGQAGGAGGFPIISEDSVFKATGVAIDFGENMNVAVTGTTVFISSIDTQGGAGGYPIISEDSVFKATGVAIDFGSNMDVVATGTTAFVSAAASGGNWQITFFAQDNEPPLSNYATLDTRNLRPVLDFGISGTAIFSEVMHPDYSAGGIDLRIGFSLTNVGAAGSSAYYQVAMERIVTGTTSLDSDGFASAINGSAVAPANLTMGLATLAMSNGVQMDSVVAGDYFRMKFMFVSGTFTDDFELHFIEIREQ